MDQICLVVSILPGRTADASGFMPEPEAGRNAAGQRSEQLSRTADPATC